MSSTEVYKAADKIICQASSSLQKLLEIDDAETNKYLRYSMHALCVAVMSGTQFQVYVFLASLLATLRES